MLNQTPFCDRQDCRVKTSEGMTTCVYYKPIYDKQGNNLNPDRNITKHQNECLTCGKTWESQHLNADFTIHNLKG